MNVPLSPQNLNSIHGDPESHTSPSINNKPLPALPERIRNRYRIRDDAKRCVLSEFISQTILSRGRNNEYISLALGWGLALLFATQLGFRISGSHLNPVVSLFFYTFGQISFLRCLYYMAAQFLGAFFGFLDALNAFDGGERYVTGPFQTAKIFATYPSDHLSIFGGIIDQLFGTAFFCITIGLITDRRNRIPTHFQPSLIGFALVTVNVAIGFNSGAAINPARDFSPRLFTLCAGYGFKVFSYRSFKWFLIPLIVPFLGGFLGAWIYQIFIGVHIPSEIDELEEEVRRIQYDKTQNSQLFQTIAEPLSPTHHKPAYSQSPFYTNQQDGRFIKVNNNSSAKKALN